ncbi:MAG: Eco57I restriction-modification methylase domain-containing protein [Akkermansiaceae bacterium]|jgi:adenine-specific DNA-methyltransferase|nr:Eco57I restriction-modification methylase domain-containing protein [Akkermansiaceae bacterium]
MTQPSASQVLALADSVGWKTCVAKERAERSQEGQFFTPPPIAGFLAGWFHEAGLDRPAIHLLDPGAGGGALTAAVVDRITSLRATGRLPRLREVTLTAWESDKGFINALLANLEACAAALQAGGIEVRIDLRAESYIDGAVRALDPGLFGTGEVATVTHAILNPPYRKIVTRSRERQLLNSLGMETSNLYAAFVWLALRQLVDCGELSAIVPRSFCNGPYFRDFRRDLVTRSTFHRVHVFDSRTEAFGRDEVLQENILFYLTRQSRKRPMITVSTGSLECPVEVRIPAERFVCPDDPEKVIHIATGSDANEIRDFIQSLPCRIEELGIEVSTGPVVDFRLKSSLSQCLGKQDVPLLYPYTVKAGRIVPPLPDASAYGDARIGKKPVAITVNDETRRWLIPAARFVLIKRFSSKEEKRRLVAGVLDPKDFAEGLIGIENHLNFFHRRRTGLSVAMAKGLCRFLNSSVADRYFRQFNGHTQVNATDLRAFRYPDAASLEQLGKASLDDSDQTAIDLAMTKLLGAPSFA